MNVRKCLSAALLCLSVTACQTLPSHDTPTPDTTPGPSAEVSEVASPPVQSAHSPATSYFLLPPDPEPATTSEQVLERLRERLVDPTCREDTRVQYWLSRYAGSPQRFASQIDDVLPLMDLVLDELDRYHLPGEFALLPLVESWYRPDARGSGDHVGLWQIGRSTATALELPVGNTYDGRMDPIASTNAALRYLAQMHNRFDNWRLATAAYNAGPARVQRLLDAQPGVKFSLSKNQPEGLPRTTFEHLAKVEALACLLTQPERFGIPLQGKAPLDPLVAIQLPPGQSSLTAIAEDRDLPADRLISLNPAFRKGFIAGNAPRSLLVPESLADQLTRLELPDVPTPDDIASPAPSVHVVRAGDTLGAIAQRHGVKLHTLFALNNLNARSILRPGQRIRLAP